MSLMKIVSEHTSIFAKHLKIKKPELLEVEASRDGDSNVQESPRWEKFLLSPAGSSQWHQQRPVPSSFSVH